ncbi:MAG: hypothetical protein JZU60_02795 [Ilumatobacteraceae bacterium]|nr:hypothetical protein [Ilumatobacteraceae bacterium]
MKTVLKAKLANINLAVIVLREQLESIAEELEAAVNELEDAESPHAEELEGLHATVEEIVDCLNEAEVLLDTFSS